MRASLVLAIVLFFAGLALGADATLKWDPSEGATGYKIYQSTDQGATWDAGVDVGNVTEYLYQGIPDTGLVMFRASAYNASGESIKYGSGCWYNGSFAPPEQPSGLGMD
jgi:hypothetical protein